MDGVFYVGENQHREMTGGLFYTSLHAEIHALFKSIKIRNKQKRISNKKVDRPNMTIYVVRLLKGAPYNGKKPDYMFGGSKPCENCQKYLSLYNVNRIKYTDIIEGTTVLCEMRLI